MSLDMAKVEERLAVFERDIETRRTVADLLADLADEERRVQYRLEAERLEFLEAVAAETSRGDD